MGERVRIDVSLPAELTTESAPDFYVGFWHPRVELRVECPKLARRVGRNWCLLSGPNATSGCLISTGPTPGSGLAFKGYLLEPPLTSWSPPERLHEYWCDAAAKAHNGVFSAACVSDEGRLLTLTVDAFGVSPLYYRCFDALGLVAFSTHSQLLRTKGDDWDATAGVQLVSCGFIPTCRTLNRNVSRVAPGQAMTFCESQAAVTTWFDLERLPEGTEEPTDRGLSDLEAAFQAALERVLRLPRVRTVLPLSSGDDSRRILAGLHHRNVEFSAVTVRILQGGDRDLDGRWATAMADHFGFRHQVLELPTPSEYAADQIATLRLTDFANKGHAWMSRMVKDWRTPGTMMLDGLAGDVLGWAGFLEEHLTLGPPAEVAYRVAEHQILARLPRGLSDRNWSSPSEARLDVCAFLDETPQTPNRADLCFLRTRTRAGPGLALQALAPNGSLPVYPYLELDHVRTALRFSPVARLREPFQGRCLKAFWPEFHRFPGARRPPPDSVRRPQVNRQLRAAGLRSLQGLAPNPVTYRHVAPLLSDAGRMAAVAAHRIKRIALRVEWWLMPVLMVGEWRRVVDPALRVSDPHE